MTGLPQGYEALEPFVGHWAVTSSAERARLRAESAADEREAFFAAGAPLMEGALDLLDRRPLADHGAEEQRLMQLMLSLAHVSMAVEIQGKDEPKGTPWRGRMRITRSPADA